MPSLDGLRALSILLVVVSHARTTVAVPKEVRRWVSAVPGNGPLGVAIFFVISGFLITHLLVREREATGRIHLRSFYVRRAFRILPAFYAFLLTIGLLAAVGWLEISAKSLLVAGAFLTNYAPVSAPAWVGHTWSLSVEEQFYLCWPALLALLVPGGRRAPRWAALGLILLAPLLRLGSWLMLPHGHLLVRRMEVLLHTRMDALMFGCLAALLYPSERFRRVLRRVWRSKLHLGAFAYLFLVAPYLATWLGPPYAAWGGYTAEGVCIALLLLWAVQHPSSRVGRVLNWRPVVHLGVISYSLYLWQQLFLVDRNRTRTGTFPLNLLCAVAAAEASYWLIERTFLRMRDRFVRPRHERRDDGRGGAGPDHAGDVRPVAQASAGEAMGSRTVKVDPPPGPALAA